MLGDIWYASGAYVYVFEAQSLRKQTNNNVSITKTNFMVRTEASEISQYLNV